MKTWNGKSACAAIAIGKIAVYKKQEQQIKRMHIQNVEEELARLEKAQEEALVQLKVLQEKAVKELGEANAMIFEAHQMMLQDEGFQEAIRNIIKNQDVNAEYAVGMTGDHYANMFAAMDDAYMKERAADVRDIAERLLANLGGKEGKSSFPTEPAIVVAEDLAPSETIQLDKSKVLAFVTRYGSANSHTAILARTMNIPAIVNTGIDLDDLNGKMAVVDGFRGVVYVEPEKEVLAHMKQKQEEERKKQKLLQEVKGMPTVTADGKEIKLYANIGNISDLANVLENDAAGIGLFRSEFLYLEKEEYPTENEQFAVYKSVLETMADKKVIIRTLDIGADKQIDYFHLEKEENPAMGYRGIRICLDRPEVFKAQLRALYRASVYGNLAIMFPMIISVDEVKAIKKMIQTVKEELKQEGIGFGQAELGIMIETPAAVMISEELAQEVDFFSIGTNDLLQYTMAIDRQNPKLDKNFDPHHPAVLRMIEMVVKSGHAHGIWVGVCGELGADVTLTETFLKMGVDELSVSPSFVLKVRKKIRECRTT